MQNSANQITRRGFLSAVSATAISAAIGEEHGHPFNLNGRIQGEFTLAAVGDLIILQPMRLEIARTSPGLLDLLQSADVVFGNFESSALDLSRFAGYPEALAGGGWPFATPDVPADLKAMGFAMLSRANNHATDWGVAGMLETDGRLDEAGIVHAGTGRSLTAARAPAYLEAKKGRVGLVALASSFTTMEPAQDALGRLNARPGVNALKNDFAVQVPAEQFAGLAALEAMLPKGLAEKSSSPDSVKLFDTTYQKLPAGSQGVHLHYTMDAGDAKAILLNVRQAKEVSDFVMVSSHTHEPGNWSQQPPEFLPLLARSAVDQGADAFIAHGPHQLRGIEIYKGKPIFYSMGNFCFMGNSLEVIAPPEFARLKTSPGAMTPAELMEWRRSVNFNEPVFFESAVAMCRFKDGALEEIALHPIDLGFNGPNGARGIPRLAQPEAAQRILERAQRLCAPLGTKVVIADGVGTIRP